MLVVGAALACARPQPAAAPWTLTPPARDLLADAGLQRRVFQALEAAAAVGTDPSLSKFCVRAATSVATAKGERTIVGGNSEYEKLPEAIHGETSLMNHAINVLGPEEARRSVDFIAFYSDKCGGGGSCGDCRDYLMTTTRWQDLLVVCGRSGDRTVHVERFSRTIVPEASFPEATAEATGLKGPQLAALVEAATEARSGGVRLFTAATEHLGVAALSKTGVVYRAAGSDDAAFHYRYPIGAVLQQAATYKDYFIDAIVVAGPPGSLPRVRYRDRQYGYEFSSFNRKRGLAPIRLILIDEPASGPRRYRLTTFEDALPGAFSAADFMPEAVDAFLSDRSASALRGKGQ